MSARSFRVQHPPTVPLLLWDGECAFCRRWIERWQGITGDRVDYAPYQEAAGCFPEISRAEFKRAVQLIEPDGTVSSGAAAVAGALARVPRFSWIARLYWRLPGLAPVADLAYRMVARHRRLLSRLTPPASQEAAERPRRRLERNIMTYNFDADGWYERERRALEHRHHTGLLGDAELVVALVDLERRYGEMLDRLDGTYQLPHHRRNR